MSPMTPQYDQDFYTWPQTQAALLRERKWADLDFANLAEELESLGKRDRRELGWRRTIRTQRDEIDVLLTDSPSLRPAVPALLTQRYPKVRLEALDETGLPDAALPPECPWIATQVLDATFWPEGDE